MAKELLFITVIGKDRKGIVARIAQFLYRNGINVEDINQKLMEDYFVMVMLVDMKGASKPLERIQSGLAKLARQMNLVIRLQHENIFKMMHRI